MIKSCPSFTSIPILSYLQPPKKKTQKKTRKKRRKPKNNEATYLIRTTVFQILSWMQSVNTNINWFFNNRPYRYTHHFIYSIWSFEISGINVNQLPIGIKQFSPLMQNIFFFISKWTSSINCWMKTTSPWSLPVL